MSTNESAAERLHSINERIAAACGRAGRRVAEVTLLGASKTVSAARLLPYLQAGLSHCGENYMQEGAKKMNALGDDAARASWHLIGALQGNKARAAVERFDCIQSVDRLSLARAISSTAAAIDKTQPIYLQVNLGDESSKAGCRRGDLAGLAESCAALAGLVPCGLMCLPPYSENAEKTRRYFVALREARDELTERGLADTGWQLSMGMSHDFEIAIEEGSTLVRVGTALFGSRPEA